MGFSGQADWLDAGAFRPSRQAPTPAQASALQIDFELIDVSSDVKKDRGMVLGPATSHNQGLWKQGFRNAEVPDTRSRCGSTDAAASADVQIPATVAAWSGAARRA